MAQAKSTSRRSTAASAARRTATGAAKSAAKGAAKGAAKAAANKAVSVGSDRVGRGTRWTEEQVSLLLDTVGSSATAKEAFEAVATQLGKSAGTVQQKYYNLQKANGGSGARRKPGRPRGSGTGSGSRVTGAAASRGGSVPTATDLRTLSVDDLVTLTTRVRDEVERRRKELDAASKLLPG